MNLRNYTLFCAFFTSLNIGYEMTYKKNVPRLYELVITNLYDQTLLTRYPCSNIINLKLLHRVEIVHLKYGVSSLRT